MRHITLTCKHHPDLLWSAKSIAVNADGSYNQRRHIFFMKGDEECPCPPSDLTFADAEAKKTWEEDKAE